MSLCFHTINHNEHENGKTFHFQDFLNILDFLRDFSRFSLTFLKKPPGSPGLVWTLKQDKKQTALGLDIGTITANNKSVSVMMLIYIKQQLSNIWSSIYEEVEQH